MSSDFYIARLALVEQQGLCKVFTAPRSNEKASVSLEKPALRNYAGTLPADKMPALKAALKNALNPEE
jgi:hypothetical protein